MALMIETFVSRSPDHVEVIQHHKHRPQGGMPGAAAAAGRTPDLQGRLQGIPSGKNAHPTTGWFYAWRSRRARLSPPYSRPFSDRSFVFNHVPSSRASRPSGWWTARSPGSPHLEELIRSTAELGGLCLAGSQQRHEPEILSGDWRTPRLTLHQAISEDASGAHLPGGGRPTNSSATSSGGGHLRNDHRYYKKAGFYDFPTEALGNADRAPDDAHHDGPAALPQGGLRQHDQIHAQAAGQGAREIEKKLSCRRTQ